MMNDMEKRIEELERKMNIVYKYLQEHDKLLDLNNQRYDSLEELLNMMKEFLEKNVGTSSK